MAVSFLKSFLKIKGDLEKKLIDLPIQSNLALRRMVFFV